ncbi:hypothetical protein QTP88_017392 [Uroleucon formosanum]
MNKLKKQDLTIVMGDFNAKLGAGKTSLYTWKSPMDKPEKVLRNQIDYILVNQRFRNSCITVKAYPEADIQSDHVPLVDTLKIRMKKIIPKNGKRYDLRKLKDPDVRENTQAELHRKLTRINNQMLFSVEKETNGFQKVVEEIKNNF